MPRERRTCLVAPPPGTFSRKPRSAYGTNRATDRVCGLHSAQQRCETEPQKVSIGDSRCGHLVQVTLDLNDVRARASRLARTVHMSWHQTRHQNVLCVDGRIPIVNASLTPTSDKT
eukprot:4455743-Pyramimonas_sp.AAC.1